MALVIIDRAGKQEIVSLDKKLTTFGASSDFDFNFEELRDSSFSILKTENSLKLIPVDKMSSKRLKGKWNESFANMEILKSDSISLVFIPGIEHQCDSRSFDWDFSKLPKDPRKNSYPQELLEFVLNSLQLEEGGLFYRRGNNLSTIGQKGMRLKERSEIMLNQFMEASSDECVMHLTFDTHTVLFEAGLNPSNFILIRSQLDEDGEVVLYLPEPEYNDSVPEGAIASMLYFASHGLSLHLAYRSNRRLITSAYESDYYWGRSVEMVEVKKLCEKLANTDLSVVINGETGTGKEGIANYFARKSNKKMVAVNCSAIPDNLAESTLFGHAKGAFTGATSNQLGKIASADRGILFLDEVGELSLEIQAKLLRFLQTGIVTPVGGREFKVDVRVVSATHKDLKAMVEKGTFREDLYYRLCEAKITLPPLRQRGDDIKALAVLFLEQAIENNSLESKVFSDGALSFLSECSWKGNIRELRSLVRKVAIICDEEVISRTELARWVEGVAVAGEFPMDLALAKKMFVKGQVEKALKSSDGNRTKAAALLGVTPRTLFRLMAENDVTSTDKNVTVDISN